MSLIMQEVSTEREIEIPGTGARRVPAVAPEPAVSRASSRAGAADARAHLLQVRRREPGRQPQAQHRGRAGVLQQGSRRQEDRHRDRRRPVGIGARVRGRALRHRDSGVHGARVVQPEAVSPRVHGDLRRALHRRARRWRPASAGRCWPRRPTATAASASRSRKRSRSPPTPTTPTTRSARCSNHVLLHQTVIGQEAIAQMEMADDYPDIVVGCTGGGSNFAGIAFPFIGAQLRGGKKVRVIAVEPAACPSLTRGRYAYDFGDTGQDDAAGEDAHARLGVHPARLPCRRPALSRHGAARLASQGTGADRSDRAAPDAVLRGRRVLRAARKASCRRPRPTTP